MQYLREKVKDMKNVELAALRHPCRPAQSGSLAWQRFYGEKTVRKAERAWFLSEGEESEALNRVAFDSLGQKQRVLEPYSPSLPSMVAIHSLIFSYDVRYMPCPHYMEENPMI